MSRPRYAWRASALTISPPTRRAISIATADLPVAVAPTRTRVGKGIARAYRGGQGGGHAHGRRRSAGSERRARRLDPHSSLTARHEGEPDLTRTVRPQHTRPGLLEAGE